MIIYLVTQDLRIQDNLALNKAMQFSHDESLPLVSVWYPFPSFHRASALRKQFVTKEVHFFLHQLEKLGISSYQFTAELTSLLNSVKANNVSKIVVTKPTGLEEQYILQRLSELTQVTQVEQGGLILANDLPFPISDTPEIFTSFRKKIEQNLVVRTPEKKLSLNVITKKIEDPDFSAVISIEHESQSLNISSCGEELAWNHIDEYLWISKSVLHYKDTRNGLL